MISLFKNVRNIFQNNKFIAVALLVASFLLFFNLDNSYLWLDEGASAQLAKHILKYGYPKAWDGKNMVTIMNGTEFDSNFIWVYQPWLTLYLIAGSFILFGVNTFAARFPFAVMGLLSVLAFYHLSRSISGREKIARLSTVLLICSIPFLLWCRQCHWYAPVILFSILIVSTFLKFFKNPNLRNSTAFILSSSGLFYSNFMYLVGLTIAIVIFTFFSGNRKRLVRLIYCEIAIAVIAAPWIIYPMYVFKKNAHSLFPGLSDGIGATLQNFTIYISKINGFFMPFFSLLIIWLISYLIWGRTPSSTNIKHNFEFPEKTKLLVLIVSCNLLAVLPFYPYPWALTRWLMSSLPIYLLLTAILLSRIISYQRIVGYTLVVLIIFTNVLHTVPYSLVKWFNIRPSIVESVLKPPYSTSTFSYPSLYGYIFYEQRFHSYLFEYVNGLFHDYEGRTEAVAKYLNDHAKQNDNVLVQTLEAEPLMFYTDLKIVNRLHPEEEDTEMEDAFQIQGQNAEKFYQLCQADYDEIDWIISGRFAFINMEIWADFKAEDFYKIRIDAPDIFFDSNPDIDGGHMFRTLKEAPFFYIYHRKSS